MNNLTNQFIATGVLSEIRVDLMPSFLKCRLALDVGNGVITCYYHVNRKFKPIEYDRLIDMLKYIAPEIDGYVYINGVRNHTLKLSTPTRLFISGNLTQREDRIFFNAEYINLTDKAPSLEISLAGVWIDKDHLMNITNDSPRIFAIRSAYAIKNNVIFSNIIQYNFGYTITDGVVCGNSDETLKIIDFKSTKKTLNDKQIADYKLEWDIITNNA